MRDWAAKRRGVIVAAVILIGTQNGAYAVELRELYRGARATAMGNAFVALANDEQAVFLNPAGLAGNKGFSLHYATMNIETSGDIAVTLLNNASAFSSLSISSANAFNGTHIYGRAQITPTLLLKNMGLSLLADNQFSIISQNQAFPQVNIGYQFTNGIQFAYGTSLRRRGRRGRGDFRIGIGGKVLWRRGGYRLVSVPVLVEKGQGILTEIAPVFERGQGLDLGVQYIHHFNPRFFLSLGSAWNDIGDTMFGASSDPQRSNFSAGFALTYKVSRISASFAYDYRHILDDVDWRKKNHMGVEFSLPFVNLYAGINQVYITYGASFDVWLIKISALSYAEDLGTVVFQDSDRRYLFHLGMKFTL